MKVGVLGGTFDPVHLGHLRVAEAVTEKLGLSEILFVPAGQPWWKAGDTVSPAADRVAMLRLALAGKGRFRLSIMEVEGPGPTYTVNTMTELRERLGPAAELFFILGWDNLGQLPRWREPSRLIALCRLVAVPRVDFPPPDLDALEAAIPGISRALLLLEEPRIDINASMVRQRVAKGLSIRGLVPRAVERYIKEHGLYRSEG